MINGEANNYLSELNSLGQLRTKKEAMVNNNNNNNNNNNKNNNNS